MDQPPNQQRPTTTGPSRDMFGGPWLGVIVFVIIAIGLGWGLISLLQQQLKTDSQSAHSGAFEHDFEPEQAYQLKRDLMLGYLADGRIVLLPGREDLPPGTTGRRTAPSIAEYRENPNNFPEHIGVVDAGTRVQFVEVIDDRSNPQTRILVMTRLLTGTYARETPVLGMHLESTDTDEETGNKRYGPRSDLFEMIEEQASPVQSNAEDPDTE